MSAGEFVRETQQIFVRWIRKTLRRPPFLFFALLQPIVWFVLFAQSFSAIASIPMFPVWTGTDNYVTFFSTAVIIQTIMASAMQSGMGMVQDMESGYLDKMRAAPIHRSSILMGKILSDAFRIVIQTLIIFGIAVAFGVTIQTGVLGLLLLILIAALFGIAWSGISNVIALGTKNSETTMMVSIITSFPLLFLSTAMLPKQLLPEWVQTVATYNPLTYIADALHALIITGWDWTLLGYAFLTILVVGALSLSGATRMFRRIVTA